MMGVCRLPNEALLAKPTRNPDIDRLAHDIRTKQTKTLSSGIDEIMAGLKESIETPPVPIDGHSHAIVCLVEHMRPPREDEPGADWILDAQDHRAALRATDVMARWGGEEFLVLLPDTPLPQAQAALERLRAQVAGLKVTITEGCDIRLTVSIGLAAHRPGDTLAQTLARADQWLYEAKAQGRNQLQADPPTEAPAARLA